jgi:hypothetical protein
MSLVQLILSIMLCGRYDYLSRAGKDVGYALVENNARIFRRKKQELERCCKLLYNGGFHIYTQHQISLNIIHYQIKLFEG